MIGSITCDGRDASSHTRLVATRDAVAFASGSPVFGFTSKCGKLLLEMSSRIRWPRANRLLVGNAVTRIGYTVPGVIIAGQCNLSMALAMKLAAERGAVTLDELRTKAGEIVQEVSRALEYLPD